MDLQQQFASKRTVRTELERLNPDGVFHLTSIANGVSGAAGGSVCVASTDIAAKCLAEATHRLATPDEIDAFLGKQEANRKDTQDVERRRDAGTYLFIPARGAK